MLWIQQIINGLSTGAVYAVIALGYTMVFGVLRLINFAPCDVMMVGAYVGYLCAVYLRCGFILSALAAAVICSLLGLAVERIGYRPLRGTTGMPMFVAALAISLLIEYIMVLIFGAQVRAYPPKYLGGVVHIGSLTLPMGKVITLAATFVILIILQLLLRCTKSGRAMRAAADDPLACSLCGVAENAPVRMAFAIGSALAGVAGVIYGSMYVIEPFMGVTIGLKAFAAAVVGGIGNVAGAVFGGLLLGLTESLTGTVFGAEYKDITAFAVMIIFLLATKRGKE